MASAHKNLPRIATIFLLTLIGASVTLRANSISADEVTRTMNIVRIYTGPDNQSHFEELQIPLKDSGKVGFLSELTKATGVLFRETGGDYN